MKERLAAIYTGVLADVLDARGLRRQTLPPDLRPLTQGMRLAGRAFTIEGGPVEIEDFDAALRRVLQTLGDVPSGHVAVYACSHDESAHLGELSVTSLKARGVEGAVVDGGCRDVRFILEEDFPVFSRYITPVDSTWRWQLRTSQLPIVIGHVQIDPGDWIVGDDDGVVVVPAGIAEEVVREAEAKASAETAVRAAVREGVLPLEAYERYGAF